MKKSNRNKKLPRFKTGEPWAFATDPKKGMTMGQAQGIGNVASGIGGLTTSIGAKDEEVNAMDYTGNILSNAGSLAASGAMLGPWGAVGGAVLGAGIGIYQSIEQDKARDREMSQNAINRGLYETSFASGSKRTTDNIRNNYNYRVPGFKNGTPSAFAPNAMIANEEGIKDPITGQLSVVPGTYDPSNPDKVMANLAPGTSVYSNNKPVPGGKSTPAKLVGRMKTVQNMADKVLSGKKPTSRIDKATAELNKKNIDIQTELLNMNTVIQNLHTAQKSGKLPRYDAGSPSTEDFISYPLQEPMNKATIAKNAKNNIFWNPGTNSWMAKASAYPNAKGERFQSYVGTNKYGEPQVGTNLYASPTKNQPVSSVDSVGSSVAQNPSTAENYSFHGVDFKLDPNAQQQLPEGYGQSTWSPQISGGKWVGNNVVTGKYVPKNFVMENSNQSGRFTMSDQIGTDGERMWIDTTGSNTNSKAVEHPQSSVGRLSFRNNTDVPQPNQDALNRLKTPLSINPEDDYLKNDKLFSSNKTQQQEPTELPEFTITAPYANTGGSDANSNEETGLKSDIFKTTIGDRLSNIGTDLMSLAPVAYNMLNSNPEVFQPRMERYTNPNLRANISKNIEDARRQRQIARYNQRNISSGSGMGSMFGSSIYSGGVEALNNIMSTADNQNNQYRTASADISNKVQNANTNEMRRVDDLNARSRAAARNMKSTALSQLSQFGQNKQLMKNMQKSDILNSEIWKAYSSGVLSPDQMSKFESILGMTSNSKKSKK